MNDPERGQLLSQLEKDNSFNGPIPTNFQFARLSNSTNYTSNDPGNANTVDTDMKANIWAGLFATDPFGDWSIPNYYCTSGNCTWSEHSSLGICSKCADISSKLNKTCNAHASDLNNATGCDVALPNGFNLGGPEGSRRNLLAASTDYSPLVYNNYSRPLSIIQVIAAYNTLFVNTSTHINATECVLTPCVINYNISYLWTSPTSRVDGFFGIPFWEIVESTNDNYSFSTSAPPWNGPTLQIGADDNQRINYQMSQPSYSTLSYYLQALFNGYVITNGTSVSYQSDNKTRPVPGDAADAMQALYAPIESCSDIFFNPIYDPASCTIQWGAWAMTTVIRNTYWQDLGLNTYFTAGETYLPLQLVRVSWPWIIPIGLLWMFCVILSVYTMWKIRRVGIHGMALNPLTFLFLNLEDNGDPIPPWWHSGDEMKKVAAQLPVRLKVTDRKASLVQAQSPNKSVIRASEVGSISN
jgi:hypothetical protein